jgi:hypothetical protein
MLFFLISFYSKMLYECDNNILSKSCQFYCIFLEKVRSSNFCMIGDVVYFPLFPVYLLPLPSSSFHVTCDIF